MKKVHIINSPLFRDKVSGYDEDSLPPIGLGYIATDLANSGHQVSLHDAVALNTPLRDLIDELNTSDYDVVALNVFTTNLHLVKELVESVQRNISFVLGGLSTKTLYRDIFHWKSSNAIDVVMGDGELIMNDLIEGQESQSPQVLVTHPALRRYFVVDQTSPYYVHDISGLELDRQYFVNEPVFHSTHNFYEANIVASRGCIYNCGFCAAARSQNREMGVRERSLESVQAELDYLNVIYPGLDSIRVLDDLFLKNAAGVENAIEMFSRHNFAWRAMAHVMSFKKVSDMQLERLEQSGCKELFIGIESGSPRVLKSINKTSNTELIANTIQRIMTAGISVKGYFIYGFPTETFDDCQSTLHLAKRIKEAESNKASFRTSVFRFRPYHGTELYHQLHLEGSTFTVQPDEGLSRIEDRQQFNFYVENYSNCSEEDIQYFIQETNALNNA